MYAETGLMFPYFQNFSPEVHHLEDFYSQSQKTNASMASLVQTSTISEYDLGGEGDLFKAPEPIIEQPVISLDPVTAAISMISCGQDVISTEELKVADIESIQREQFLSDVFYDCKDMLGNEATETPLSEVLNFQIPFARTDDNPIAEENLHPQGPLAKSVSSECLSSMDWIQNAQINPNLLNLTEMDFGATYGMRRAFSEGDIKTLGNGNVSLTHSPLGQPQMIADRISEDRWQKLSRYRNKKTKRNFGRKIKYACRKALADSQPRIRGRFAKTEEYDTLRK